MSNDKNIGVSLKKLIEQWVEKSCRETGVSEKQARDIITARLERMEREEVSVDCWINIDFNPNTLDALYFHIPDPYLDFGDARDGNQEVLANFFGSEITDELIEQLMSLPNSSTKEPEDIRAFLENHKGRKIYFTYV